MSFYKRTIIILENLQPENFSFRNSRAADDHVTAFFQDRPFFVFSDNLGYSLLKNARHPNFWLPCEGVW